MQEFFNHIRRHVFRGRLTQGQVDGINAILAHAADLPVSHRAYLLATVVRETGSAMQPVNEVWGPTAQQKGYEGRADLGNTQKGDGYRYRGRGLVQITGRANYADWAERTGLPLVEHPELALEDQTSLRILVDGCTLGTFTGKKLSDYLPGDYVQARRVVNGLDHATEIARNAEAFEEALRLADKPRETEVDRSAPPLPLPPVVAPAPMPAPVPAAPVVVAESSDGEALVNQPTNRTVRKVEYASKAGGVGALAGVVLATWTFGLLPESFQQTDQAMLFWSGAWAGGIAFVASLQLGRHVRERLSNVQDGPK